LSNVVVSDKIIFVTDWDGNVDGVAVNVDETLVGEDIFEFVGLV
jgi:hypothetical protein